MVRLLHLVVVIVMIEGLVQVSVLMDHGIVVRVAHIVHR